MASSTENGLLGDVRDDVELDGPVVVLPVRHHSPACAWHVRRWILDHRPTAVLIEGPSDANALIDELLDERTQPPVALYCFVRAAEGRPGTANWYPFCEHSPEWIALRAGREVGAELAFVDLPSWWKGVRRTQEGASERLENSYGDHQLRFSGVTEELCRRTGTRDFDELWDSLFEADGFERPPQKFFSDLATFSRLARASSGRDADPHDDALEREAFMTERVREKLATHERVLVLVGGFHRGAILERLQRPPEDPTPPTVPKSSERGCYLTMYSDRQLDRWGGYEAGLPAPAFYRELWREANAARKRSAGASMLGRIARRIRRAGAFVSTADLIAAEQMFAGLARFRGHATPTREDLRDAVRTAWVKGALDDAHGRLAQLVDEALIGDRRGAVTPDAGTPPIVRDFHHEVRRLRLPDRPEPGDAAGAKGRLIHLDLYQRPVHRAKSAFLHRTARLGLPYAKLQAGPDFAKGTDLERVREVWQVGWHPRVDGALIEQARRGATVAEAAANLLLEATRAPAASQGASHAVSCLTSALVMAFDELAGEFVELVDARLRSTGDFMDAADALSGLVDLAAYRAVLGGDEQPAVGRLAKVGYERAVWLVDSLPGLVDSAADRQSERALRSLARLRHVALAQPLPELQEPLFVDAMERVRPRLGKKPLLEGAAVGCLRQAGRIGEKVLLHAVACAADNTAAGDASALGDFLRGLFALGRHAVSCGPEILETISRCIGPMDEEKFLETLPGLRLAFTRFPPRELRRIAERINESLFPMQEMKEPSNPTAGRSVDAQVKEFVARYLARELDETP